MLSNLYVKDEQDLVWTKVVAVLLIDSVPTYVDAHGEKYVVGEAEVIDIERHTDQYLGINWHKFGVTFETYEREWPRGL